MITLGSATKVHLLAGVTDMRRGFEGLFALARALLEAVIEKLFRSSAERIGDQGKCLSNCHPRFGTSGLK